MTTELIKELVGLAVEKGLRIEYNPDYIIEVQVALIDLDKEDAAAQLQDAIDRIKGL